MTRETKIGLLVGLAFIIVIGILLSDHLTSSTEPPHARLAQAGDSVRSTIVTPATTQQPPITIVEQAAPVNPVPVRTELTQPRPPVQIVEIGPGTWEGPVAQGNQVTPQNSQNPTGDGTAPSPMAPDVVYVHVPTPTDVVPTLQDLALRHDEELVPVDRPGQATGPASRPIVATQTVQGFEYEAQPGDTLSKMAGRFMGGNTEANRDAIISANPSLAKNPDMVIVGRMYIIPAPPPAAQQASSATASVQTSSSAPAASGDVWYTAKEGDSLWKIAAEQLGDGNLYKLIQEMNTETLRGGDIVQPGMRLRLPPKAIAAAQ